MTAPRPMMSCPCCHGWGGYAAPTHLDPAEYCDLCYGAGWVTPQRRAAWVAHRAQRDRMIASQPIRRPKHNVALTDIDNIPF